MQLHVEWNAAGSDRNVSTHGVSFAEGATVLGDPHSRTITDTLHTADSSRFVTLGLSHRARMLVVSHVDRGGSVWILGVRRALRTREAPAKTAILPASTPEFGTLGGHDFSVGIRGKYAARYWEAAAVGRLTRARK
jgi:uncharacterized DUF497 family protein